MAKKNKSFVTPPPEEEAQQEATLEQEPAEYIDNSVQKIYDLLQSLDISGGKCRIYLKRQTQIRPAYIGEMSIETFRDDGLETLKRTYGGGDYTFQFVDSTGQYLKAASLTIDPRFKGEMDAPPKEAAPPPDEDRLEKIVEKLKPAPDGNMMPLMITLITESQKTMVALMAENQKATNTILTGLMATISQASNKPATDPLLLEMIRQKTDKTPLLETIEAMVALRSLQEGEQAPKPDMVEKLITTMGPTLMNILARQQQQQPPPPPTVTIEQTRAIGAEAPAASGAGQAAPGVNGAPGAEPKLKDFIPMLLNAARKGTPPAAYYEVICDNIPDDQLEKLIVELETPGWFESLFGSHPEVVAQKAWLEKLRLVFLDADEEELPAAEQKGATN
jgi:hypothetical protein